MDSDTLNTDSLVLNFDSVGLYSIQLQLINEFGCATKDVFDFEFLSVPEVVIDTFVDPCQMQIIFNLSKSKNIYKWLFTDPIGKIIEGYDSQLVWSFADTGSQVIHFYAETTRGCSQEMDYSVYVPSPEKFIFVPNSFTPNADGLNDVFKMSGYNHTCYGQTELMVFNRWGQMVYYDIGLSPTWDGQMEKLPMFVEEKNGANDPNISIGNYPQDNVFVYVFKNKLFAVKGNVTVLKPNK